MEEYELVPLESTNNNNTEYVFGFQDSRIIRYLTGRSQGGRVSLGVSLASRCQSSWRGTLHIPLDWPPAGSEILLSLIGFGASGYLEGARIRSKLVSLNWVKQY